MRAQNPLEREQDVLQIFKRIDVHSLEIYLDTLETSEREALVAQIFEPIRLVNSSSSLQVVIESILTAALSITRAERGFISLKTLENKVEFKYGLHHREGKLELEDFHVNREILDETLAKATPIRRVLELDGHAHERQYTLVAPLFIHRDLVGILYLYSSNELIKSSEPLWQFFQIFCNHASQALRNAQFYSIVRHAKAEKENYKKSMMQADQMVMKGTMAAKVGHEINNFLSGLNANIEMAGDLLNNRGKRKEVVDRLSRAQAMVTNMANLANSLMQKTNFEGNFQKSSVNTLITNFFDFIRPIYKSSPLQLEKDLDPALPDVSIDAGLMMQVMFNLVKNAVEAKPDGVITVSTERKNHHEISIVIADNGPGIPKEKQLRIFEPLFTDKSQGHGYGLAICKDIIEKHKGEIKVDSQPGKGTRFIITLPLSLADDYGEIEFDRLELLEERNKRRSQAKSGKRRSHSSQHPIRHPDEFMAFAR